MHCVIVGLASRGSEPAAKRLFSYGDIKGEPTESEMSATTAYLFGAAAADRLVVVESVNRPIDDAPLLGIGSQAIDDGNLTFDHVSRSALLAGYPSLDRLLCPMIGADKFINGSKRWLINLRNISPAELRSIPILIERVRRNRAFRLKSIRKITLATASTSERFALETIPTAPFLVIPRVSSERRDYHPIGMEFPPAIPTDAVIVLLEATLYHFGILTSRMHMAWLRHIGGRLKSDFRYSIGLVYNTFPWPDATLAQTVKAEALAQAILDARALPKNATSTLADLYDPDTMPAELRRAHRDLDTAVDRLYCPAGFDSDRARVEHLFTRYRALVEPTSAAAALNRKTVRRTRKAAVA